MKSDLAPITDPTAVVAELEHVWGNGGFRGYSGDLLQRIADSAHNQPHTNGVNPYWDIVRQFPLQNWNSGSRHAVEVDWRPQGSSVGRTDLVKTFAWSIPTPGDVSWLAQQLDGRGVIEIGAGTGYWAGQLATAGVDVVAYDVEPVECSGYCHPIQYHPVHQGGPEQAGAHPTRALMLCWPPMSSMAHDALAAYRGDLLVYIGESAWGCTADDDFFELLEKEWDEVGESPHHATFSGIHCFVTVYRRKGADR